jgi:hypothetical protein
LVFLVVWIISELGFYSAETRDLSLRCIQIDYNELEIIWNNGVLAKFTILSPYLLEETEENTINLKQSVSGSTVHLTAIEYVCDIGLCGITACIIYLYIGTGGELL